MNSENAIGPSTEGRSQDQPVPLPLDTLSLVAHIFQTDDPIITQSLLSFSFHDVSWKLDAWKKILPLVSQTINHFSFSFRQVQQFLDLALVQLGMAYVTPTETILDVAQILDAVRNISKRDVVVRHVERSWDPQARKDYFQRILLDPLPEVQISSKNSCQTSIFGRLYNFFSATLPSTSGSFLNSFTWSQGSGVKEKCHLLHVERHLPYTPGVSCSPLTLDSEFLHFQTLQTWGDEFIEYVKGWQDGDASTGRYATSTPMDVVPFQSTIVLLSLVQHYLKGRMKKDPTTEDVYIFVWFLAFFIKSYDCQPFLSESKHLSNDPALFPIQGLKIVWGGSRFLSGKHEESCEIHDQDRVKLVEIHAVDILCQRLRRLEAMVCEVEKECKKALQAGKQSVVLMHLKKKKFLENQLRHTEAQLVRVEEAAQSRDATTTMAIVASALEASSTSLKISLDAAGRLVADAKSGMKDSQVEMEKIQGLLKEPFVDTITDASLEEEYNTMLLESFPHVPENVPENLLCEFNPPSREPHQISQE